MSQFLMAIGLPASGKSSYGEQLLHSKDYLHPWVIISSDSIREEVFGDVNDQSHNNEVFNIMFNRARKALKDNKNIYYDACNLSSKKRINLIKELKKVDYNIEFNCILFVPSYEICLERNKNRNRVVPEYAIKRMLKSFEPPHVSEGWNKIYFNSPNNKEKLEKILRDLLFIEHDNPHHALSIGAHMMNAQAQYLKDYPYKNRIKQEIYIAIRYHDIGKGFCKVFSNFKGEPTSIAHYFCHENVGAYIYLSYCNSYNIDVGYIDVIEIANLIAHHMDFYKGDKYLEKIRKRFGKDFYDKLEIVHKYDMAAH